MTIRAHTKHTHERERERARALNSYEQRVLISLAFYNCHHICTQLLPLTNFLVVYFMNVFLLFSLSPGSHFNVTNANRNSLRFCILARAHAAHTTSAIIIENRNFSLPFLWGSCCNALLINCHTWNLFFSLLLTVFDSVGCRCSAFVCNNETLFRICSPENRFPHKHTHMLYENCILSC